MHVCTAPRGICTEPGCSQPPPHGHTTTHMDTHMDTHTHTQIFGCTQQLYRYVHGVVTQFSSCLARCLQHRHAHRAVHMLFSLCICLYPERAAPRPNVSCYIIYIYIYTHTFIWLMQLQNCTHTHTKPHLQTTAHLPHTGNVSSILSLPCSPSLFAPGYIHSASTFIQARRGRELLCLSQTRTAHHIDVCVCAQGLSCSHKHPVYEYGCSHRSRHTVHSLSLQIYRENTLISHTVLSIKLYTRTCAHRDLHAGTPLSLYMYAYIYSYARRAGHTDTISLSIHIHNELYTHTALYSYAL